MGGVIMLSFVCEEVYPESSVSPGADTGSAEPAEVTCGALTMELVGLSLVERRCL